MGRGRWKGPKRRQVFCQFTYLLSFLVLCHTTSSTMVLKSFPRKHAPDLSSYLPASAPAPTSSNSTLTVQNNETVNNEKANSYYHDQSKVPFLTARTSSRPSSSP